MFELIFSTQPSTPSNQLQTCVQRHVEELSRWQNSRTYQKNVSIIIIIFLFKCMNKRFCCRGVALFWVRSLCSDCWRRYSSWLQSNISYCAFFCREGRLLRISRDPRLRNDFHNFSSRQDDNVEELTTESASIPDAELNTVSTGKVTTAEGNIFSTCQIRKTNFVFQK